MATNEDTTAQAQAALALRRAAERVIREYRAQHEIEAGESAEGIMVRMRPGLALVLDDLETALDVAVDTAEVLGDAAAEAAETDAREPFDNPIRAFLLGTKWLEGSCYCGHHEAQLGHELLAAMAADITKQDAVPTMPLSVEQCAAVLAFIGCRTEREVGHVTVSGGYVDYPHTEKYGGDPGFGLFLILGHIEQQLRKAGAA